MAEPRTFSSLLSPFSSSVSAVGMSDREKSEYYLRHVMHHIADVHREATELITSDWQENLFAIGCFRTFAKIEDFRKLKRKILKLVEDFHRKHQKPSKGAPRWPSLWAYCLHKVVDGAAATSVLT